MSGQSSMAMVAGYAPQSYIVQMSANTTIQEAHDAVVAQLMASSARDGISNGYVPHIQLLAMDRGVVIFTSRVSPLFGAEEGDELAVWHFANSEREKIHICGLPLHGKTDVLNGTADCLSTVQHKSSCYIHRDIARDLDQVSCSPSYTDSRLPPSRPASSAVSHILKCKTVLLKLGRSGNQLKQCPCVRQTWHGYSWVWCGIGNSTHTDY